MATEETEAPARAKAAGNGYSLHLRPARLSSTLQFHLPRSMRQPRPAVRFDKTGLYA